MSEEKENIKEEVKEVSIKPVFCNKCRRKLNAPLKGKIKLGIMAKIKVNCSYPNCKGYAYIK